MFFLSFEKSTLRLFRQINLYSTFFRQISSFPFISAPGLAVVMTRRGGSRFFEFCLKIIKKVARGVALSQVFVFLFSFFFSFHFLFRSRKGLISHERENYGCPGMLPSEPAESGYTKKLIAMIVYIPNNIAPSR